MNARELLKEITAAYKKHGWQLQRVLMRADTFAEMPADITELEGIKPQESAVDALWFSRPSHAQREAWELRLLAETPFALFETFEPDETEEQREELRREMEARLLDHLTTRSVSRMKSTE
jgi:hypothetical protein